MPQVSFVLPWIRHSLVSWRLEAIRRRGYNWNSLLQFNPFLLEEFRNRCLRRILRLSFSKTASLRTLKWFSELFILELTNPLMETQNLRHETLVIGRPGWTKIIIRRAVGGLRLLETTRNVRIPSSTKIKTVVPSRKKHERGGKEEKKKKLSELAVCPRDDVSESVTRSRCRGESQLTAGPSFVLTRSRVIPRVGSF